MTRQQILEEAIKCVTKDRNATHGDPEDNFRIIAELWTIYLSAGLQQPIPIDSINVSAMMLLMKVSRLITSPHHQDHWVDIAGYAACGGEIATKNDYIPKSDSTIK